MAYLHFWFTVKRKKVVSVQIQLSYMQVTADFARKTYLDLISLITIHLINV